MGDGILMSDTDSVFTTGTGVSPATFEITGHALGPAGRSGGQGGSVTANIGTAPGIRFFSVYYDMDDKRLKVHDPTVIADGSSVTVEHADIDVTAGQLVCSVWVENDVTKARLEYEGDHDGLLAKVPIAYITDPGTPGGVIQQHVGAIVVGGGQIIGEEGRVVGSKADGVSGTINAKGESGSGLVMKTYKSGEDKTLSVDLSGRESSDSFGIKDIKDKAGTVVSKVLATSGFSLPQADEATVDVLSGIDTVEINLTGESPNIKIKFNKMKLTVIKTDVVSETADAVIPLEKCDVVESSDYNNDGDYKFVNHLTGLLIPGHSNPDSENPDPEVFTAVPHSSNSSNS